MKGQTRVLGPFPPSLLPPLYPLVLGCLLFEGLPVHSEQAVYVGHLCLELDVSLGAELGRSLSIFPCPCWWRVTLGPDAVLGNRAGKAPPDLESLKLPGTAGTAGTAALRLLPLAVWQGVSSGRALETPATGLERD